MTMPFSLSSKERLLWLEEWMYSSAEGLLIQNRTIDLLFSYEKDIDKTMRYLINNPNLGWIYLKDNEMIAPNGVNVRFYYDTNTEELLNQYKK